MNVKGKRKSVPPPAGTASGNDPLPAAEVKFPIVGIGASAGGLKAFELFLNGMPADAPTGFAFVFVQHLSPDHKSLLSGLVKRYTRMEVFEVEDGMPVRPDCVYIIPPNRDMALLNGRLELLEPASPRGQRLPIDYFFRSLAQDQGERAIGIVLSGTGSDGAEGVRAIKGEGGMVMAQTPESAESDRMPRSAVATGLVDFVMEPIAMARQIVSYVAHPLGTLTPANPSAATGVENEMKKVFILLRGQTGHDFSQYKTNTISRRIEHRMAVHRLEDLGAYVRHLQKDPHEVETLFRDLLIGVTRFFRDPKVFEALQEEAIPHLFQKSSDGTVRVWIPGCSTGEEAYSIAIILQEQMEARKLVFKVQMFATDIDSKAVVHARSGLYPASIAADVSPERLSRFFSLDPDVSAYRVKKEIRNMLVFSEQDLARDPPFSKLDLISCRNVLIYMCGNLQEKVIPRFHYALNPGGMLLLGSSESVGNHPDLFVPLNRKSNLYRRKEGVRDSPRAARGQAAPPAEVVQAAPPAEVVQAAPPAEVVQAAPHAEVVQAAPHAEEVQAAPPAEEVQAAPPAEEGQADPRIVVLMNEIRTKEEHLRAANEKLEASNEEYQATNEELQSTNEELQTSEEELQSVNEELSTVNAELQDKVVDLTRVNNDMNNLIAGTGIGTIFVDHKLRILRFTPAVTQVINLIPVDVGRQVGHINSNLAGYDALVEDVTEVLDSLVPKEVEVQTKTGACFLMRIMPYRTQENVIEGAVLTFTEITEMKKAQAAIRESDALRRLAAVVRDSCDAILSQNLKGRILSWNPAAERMYGYTEAEALTMNVQDLIPADRRAEAASIVKRLARADVLKPARLQRIAKDGRIVEVWATATALMGDDGEMYAVAMTERNATEGGRQDG